MTIFRITIAWTILLMAGAAWAEEPASNTTKEADPKTEKAAKSEKPDQAELERQFAETLTGATLRGHWRLLVPDGDDGDQKLSDPRPELYHIASARKLNDDYWVITARIQYGDNDVTLPVPVRVVWAGDTPVITVDNYGFPGLGTYSARVMIYGGLYSGTWSGTDCLGGTLAGQVLKSEPDEKDAKPEKAESPSAK